MSVRVRNKKSGDIGFTGSFNTSTALPQEILVTFENDYVTDFITEYEVFLAFGPRAGRWVDMMEAFENHDLINDNENRIFFEPTNDEDRKRGYTLT